MDFRRALLFAAAGGLPQGGHAAHRVECPGQFGVQGIGNVSLIPAGWAAKEGPAEMEVRNGAKIVTHMGGRGYFASSCTAGVYDNAQYLALDLRGKTLKYTTDLSAVGCGCNAAFYLTNMRQNQRPSDCGDYYCDANNVCGESCAEIDIQEGNLYSWHSTLHSAHDHSGMGKGYGGGGAQWSGPRDWSGADFGVGGRCIDTKLPFEVSVSFPKNEQGLLSAMDITLTQKGKKCPLSLSLGSYSGMGELDAALAAGMTPIVSYWNSADMLWMDGKGKDGKGPCPSDSPEVCGDSISFYGFSVTPAFPPTTPPPEATSTTPRPSRESSSWALIMTWAFICGIGAVLMVQAVGLLYVWVSRRQSAKSGDPVVGTPSLLNTASPQHHP